MTGENRGRGRPRKTESTYADTRNDLIRSGLELLTQNGFLATGVDAIVKNAGNDSNLLIVFYVQIMPDDFVMQLHR
ncbi:hypothetical protein, partial [Escherichia coli]|uniref:hypothetical protein n=1 Tax=Escherichia coli TaxID=562 RepID=UPI001FCED536